MNELTLQDNITIIVERAMNKLAGWKVKFQSFAGRAVLIESIMSAIPNHVM